MPAPFYPGIPLDEWTDIVRVSWDLDTILDFVHDKYQVKGRRQTRTQVIWGINGFGHNVANTWVQTPTSVPGFANVPPEGIGLDLRGPVDGDGVPTLLFGRRAQLRNKVPVPTKTNPGALNEFTFLNYTIVYEFDYFDDALLSYNQAGGFNPVNGGWSKYSEMFGSRYSRTNEGSNDGNFTLEQTMEGKEWGDTAQDFVGENDYDFWTVDPAYGLDAFQSGAGPTAGYTDGLGNFFAYVGAGNGDSTSYYRSRYYQYVPPPASPAGTTFIGITGTEPTVFFGPSTLHIDGGGSQTLETRPSVAGTDQRFSDFTAPAPFTGIKPRVSPGEWDSRTKTGGGHWWHSRHPGAAAPYGRVRIAANVTPASIAVAANGGSVGVKTQASRIQIPRITPNDPLTGKPRGWFPARELPSVANGFTFIQGADVTFQGFIRVRYVRLYRKLKPVASLTNLSRVPARIPKWWSGTT